jgi:hypothetical protein
MRNVDAGATTESEESGIGSAGVKLKKAGSATSAYAIHLLCSTSSKSSLYDSPVASYLADVRRN